MNEFQEFNREYINNKIEEIEAESSQYFLEIKHAAISILEGDGTPRSQKTQADKIAEKTQFILDNLQSLENLNGWDPAEHAKRWEAK